MDRILMKVQEAGEALGLSRSKLYELIAAGEIKTIRVGRAVRVPAASLHEWVQSKQA